MLYTRYDLKLSDLQLCKLWFLCFYKNYDLPKNLAEIQENLIENHVILEKIPSYKLSEKEIIKVGDSWFVGDGFGNIKYSPNRENKDYIAYVAGNLPISEKYKVLLKD